MPFDLSLYFIADSSVSSGRDMLLLIRQAMNGGITMLQLREKHLDTSVLLDYARAVRKMTRAGRIPLIINDRIDVAESVGADGVHLGQNDASIDEARRRLGKGTII